MRVNCVPLTPAQLEATIQSLPPLTWKEAFKLNALVWKYHRFWRKEDQHVEALLPTDCSSDYDIHGYGLCVTVRNVFSDNYEFEEDHQHILNSWPKSAYHADNIGSVEEPVIELYIIPSDSPTRTPQERYHKARLDSSMVVGSYGAARIDLLKFFVKKRVRHSGFLKRLFLTASILTASKGYKIGQ